MTAEAARHPELGRGDFSTAFLSMYEDVKKRLKARGMHASIQTLEKYQAMILVFMEKGRPLKPYELLDALIFNPSFSACKDAKRMVFYVLQRLLRIGVVEKVEHKGRKGYYRLADHKDIKAPPKSVGMITDPRVKPLLNGWKRVFELRNMLKLWNIPSLGHALAYELIHILGYVNRLRDQSGEDGRERLEALSRDMKRLLEVYVNYTRAGVLDPGEAGLFHACEKGVEGFSKRIWWK